MSRTLLNELGPVRCMNSLSFTDEEYEKLRSRGPGYLKVTVPVNGPVARDRNCIQYVDVVINNEDTEEVVRIWNNITGGKLLHEFTHEWASVAVVKGPVVLKEKIEPEIQYVKVKREGYDEIRDLYIKYGLVEDEEEFYKVQKYRLKEDALHSALEWKEEVVTEEIPAVVDDTKTVVRIYLYLNDLATVDIEKVKDAVRQISKFKK